jgi:hypothetical protein
MDVVPFHDGESPLFTSLPLANQIAAGQLHVPGFACLLSVRIALLITFVYISDLFRAASRLGS